MNTNIDWGFLIPVLANIGIFIVMLAILKWMQNKFYSFSHRVLVGLAFGIVLGVYLNVMYGVGSDITKSSITWIYGVGNIYVRLLRMIIFPIVFISILSSITNLNSGEELGSMGSNVLKYLMITVSISALIGVVITYSSGLTANDIEPGDAEKTRSEYLLKTNENVQKQSMMDRVAEMFPTNPFQDLTGARSSSTIAVVIFASFLGIAYLGIKKKKEKEAQMFKDIVSALKEIIMRVTTLVLRLTPFGVASLMARTIAISDFDKILGLINFVMLSYVGLALIFIVHLIFLSTAGLSPIIYIKKSWEVLTFAFTSRSSAAALPMTINTLEKRFGVSEGLSTLAGSLGTSVGQNGCAGLYPAMLAVMIAPTLGINPLEPIFLIELIIIIAISSFGVAGIGGGATFASLIVLSSIGFPVEIAGLLISIEPVIDMARTAVNVSGSMMSALVSAKRMNEIDISKYNDMSNTEQE